MENNKSTSPPKARLTFRVGIVGHRPNRLRRGDIPSLMARLAEVLLSVKTVVEAFPEAKDHVGLFADASPCLRGVSSLAEGTDRYFALEALRLGYELCCPLPFHKEEFEKDFRPEHSVEPDVDSVADFNNILKDAKNKSGLTLFELDGSRSNPAEAYGAAGRVVLNQSDLLIIVWDGGGNNKRGGTYETLREALAFSVPVLWIDAHAPHSWQFLLKECELPVCSGERCTPKKIAALEHNPLFGEIKNIVNQILEPPIALRASGTDHGQKPDLRADFFAQTNPPLNLFFIWKLFRDMVGSFRLRRPRLRVPDIEEEAAGDWPKDAPGVAGWVNTRLIGHYAWADRLADYYADAYRSSFVLCYFLGAAAVMLALIPVLFGLNVSHPSPVPVVCSVLECLVVVIILIMVGWGKRKLWHDRWMEYRLVAELVRQLRFLIPLGGGRPFPRLPQHLGNYGNPAHSWMYWHLRAIDRAVGLPNAKVKADYLKDCLGYVAKIVQGQGSFHHTAADRSERINHRLHLLGCFLFAVVLLLIFAHLILHLASHDATTGVEGGWHYDAWTFFGAFLPAVGAAMAAINNQGEFGRIAKRSRAMAERLDQMNSELGQLLKSDAAIRSSEAANHALRVAQTMVDEVLDWRVVFLDRPLVTPA